MIKTRKMNILVERVLTRSTIVFGLIIITVLGCENKEGGNDYDSQSSVNASLYSSSYRIGPFHIGTSFRFKSFSNESADLYGYATDSVVEIFEMNSGVKVLSHNVFDIFNDSIGQINSFVIDSLSYVIVTDNKLFVYHEDFSVIDLTKWVQSGLVIGNLTTPAYSAKESKLCFSLIDYRNVAAREHLYDYNHVGVLDLSTGEMSIVEVPYSASMRTYGNHIVPFTYITFHDRLFVVSSSIDEKVYLINDKDLSVSSYGVKSALGDVVQLSLDENKEIAKAKNQEFGFKYLKAWVNREDSIVYRLVRLQREAKLKDGAFTSAEDQPYSLISYSLSSGEQLEFELPRMKAGQDMEMFLHQDEICYRTNYVLSKSDTSWNFIFNCYSIR